MVSIISQVETGHEDMVHDAQMDYFGTKLATCSSDKSVRIYSVSGENHSLIATLEGHEGPVWQIAWAHPTFGNLLASCSYDRKVFIWKETSSSYWEKVHEYGGHDSSVNSISWAPKEFGLILLCGSSDGAVSVLTGTGDNSWDTKKLPNAHTAGCNAVSWCPAVAPAALSSQVFQDPSSKAAFPAKRFVTGGCDNLAKIWKYEEEEDKWIEEKRLEAHSDWIRDVAWAPSVGLPTSYIASCSQDRRVIIWSCSVENGTTTNWTPRVLKTFDDVVWHVSWSVMGNILAVSGGDNKNTSEMADKTSYMDVVKKSTLNDDDCETGVETTVKEVKSPLKEKLESWLNKSMKIEMTDGRTLVGIFLCTDRDKNVILGNCLEYLGCPDDTDEDPRALGLAMVPGRFIKRVCIDDTMYT
ncbi:Protein SEC13 -like protein [Halotydeus destructor]|nr:Protein SEC13 -like protein [Halotydeus destructor]